MMKKIRILCLAAASLLSLQSALAENDPTIRTPQIICGEVDPNFSYANTNLSIALRTAAETHPDNTFFTSTYLIIPVTTEIKDAATSQSVITRDFMGCAAQNYLSESEMISNNKFQNEVSQQICGDKFPLPKAAINLLNFALQNNATPNKHMVISSFNIERVKENSDNDSPNNVVTQNFQACASVIISNN